MGELLDERNLRKIKLAGDIVGLNQGVIFEKIHGKMREIIEELTVDDRRRDLMNKAVKRFICHENFAPEMIEFYLEKFTEEELEAAHEFFTNSEVGRKWGLISMEMIDISQGIAQRLCKELNKEFEQILDDGGI